MKSYNRQQTRTLLSRLGSCLLICFLLSGCALSAGPAPTRVKLMPKLPQSFSLPTAQNKQIVVALPSAGSDIDTDAIAQIVHRREVVYLPGIRWTNTAPRLLQTAVIDALEATGTLQGVMDESSGIAANARLTCDLKQFSLVYQDSAAPPTAVIQATFKLVNLTDGSIIGTLPITVSQPAASKSEQDLILACEEALSGVLKQVAPWAVKAIGQIR